MEHGLETPSPAVLLDMLQSISQGVLLASPDRRILFCNAAFSNLTGFTRDEIVGTSCSILQGPATDPKTILAMREALERGEGFSGEILNYKKDGETFWNELTISPIHSRAARLEYFIGVQQDISKRKGMESAFRTMAERHSFRFDHMLAGVVVHAANTKIVYANATAERMLGIDRGGSRGLVAGDPSWHFIRGDGSPMPTCEYPVNRAIASRSDVEHQLVGKSHGPGTSPTWLLCNACLVLDTAGAPQEVVVSFTDVTELELAKQAARKSEERLRLILRGSNDAPWDFDLVTGASYYSPRWWKMLGYEENGLPADASLWRRLLNPDDRDAVERDFLTILQSSEESYEMELLLRHKDGHYVPVLSRGFVLRHENGRALRVSGVNSDLTERKRAETQINRLVSYDPLTHLPNRRLLMLQLRRALLGTAQTHRVGALLYIDLDQLKLLNDTLGQDSGDQVLQQVAARVQGCVRDPDTVARLGGDEFVVLLEDLNDTQQGAALDAELVGQRILAALRQPYTLQGTRYRGTSSIGIALFQGGGAGVDDVLKQAGLAVYEAKAIGGNSLRFFDASMQIAVDARVAMEQDLRDGLDRQEMVLYFQPQVDDAARVVGAEALVRWRHPERGMVAPADFIPLAEATGLIVPLGQWVLRNACETLRDWARKPSCHALSLSVNVSAKQLYQPDFVPVVLAILHDTGADPNRLKLELTESLMAENTEETIGKMAQLKARGVRFVLDDFGTGYSSLSYLQRMPLTQLKIDKCFVHDVQDDATGAAIARIIITLGEKLGLEVIAEGVETDAQLQFLRQNGCGLYQGYLFSRPVPLDVLETQMINARRLPVQA
jgi:diguanylate cyclase (GGDEF)-like protein/PAS domain S-box-containing protein